MHTSYDFCIRCFARSLYLIHLWCLDIDHDSADDAIIEAPVVDYYGWRLADQEVELDDGVPTHGV